MSDGISAREFARREGVSDTLVRRAIKQGRLKLSEGKLIDPALVGTAWREGNAKGANTTANKGANTAPVRGTPTRPAMIEAIEVVGHVEPGETLEAAAERMINSGQVPVHDYAEALRRKENFLALLRQLEFEQKSGTLVDLALAERVLFEGARAQRDAWLSWPSRVGPLLAADFGLEADKVTGALTEHVHKHIAQLGEPDVHFTK